MIAVIKINKLIREFVTLAFSMTTNKKILDRNFEKQPPEGFYKKSWRKGGFQLY